MATIIVRIRALTPGRGDERRPARSPTGTLTTPAPGIDAEVHDLRRAVLRRRRGRDCETVSQALPGTAGLPAAGDMAWIKQKLLEFPCATRVCVREGSCCRCDAECTDCGCKNCGNRMEFYVLFDDVFPCGIPPQNIVDDITDWLFGEHQGYGEGQVEIGVCGQIYAPMPLMVNVIIDIARLSVGVAEADDRGSDHARCSSGSVRRCRCAPSRSN